MIKFLRNKINNQGFTLAELLIVIIIIVSLTAFMLPKLSLFNRSQSLENEASKLQSALRVAQNNAASGIKCNSTTVASDWYIRFASNNSYFLESTCSGSSVVPTAVPTGAIQTLNLKVSGANDDATEERNNGNTYSGVGVGTVLEFGALSSIPRHIGFRFTGSGLNNLAGATINSATLTLYAEGNSSGAFNGTWYGQNSANPLSFSNCSACYNISSTGNRSRTIANLVGDNVQFGDPWSNTNSYILYGFGNIIQELVNNHGSTPISAIVLMHIYGSGSGSRVTTRYDYGPTRAAQLRISYTPPAVPTAIQSPTTTSTPPTSIGYNLPSGISVKQVQYYAPYPWCTPNVASEINKVKITFSNIASAVDVPGVNTISGCGTLPVDKVGKIAITLQLDSDPSKILTVFVEKGGSIYVSR